MPLGSEVVVMLGVAELMTAEKLWLVVTGGVLLSATFTVKLKFPVPAGVPLIDPLEGLKLSPGGRLPPLIDQVYGRTPFCAPMLAE